ncbi:MAG: AAA family ATPase [Clostridia bacterium]|nr:AAA family ATPase [Clostridia bacterium]
MSMNPAAGSLKPLPVSITDYEEAVTGYYCVDKTLFIRDILDKRFNAVAITRPEGFGKSLNMSMLMTFLEDTGEDKSAYFKGTKIWQCGERYISRMGTYPVIYISLETAKGPLWGICLHAIKKAIAKEFRRWAALADHPKLTPYERKVFCSIEDGFAGTLDYSHSLQTLSECVCKCCSKKPIILVDDFDAPLRSGSLHGYYEEAKEFLRTLYGSSLKDNFNMEFAVLEGVCPDGISSLFTDFNCIKTYTVLDKGLSSYFGFMADEVKDMLDYYGCGDRYDAVCKWYGGHRCGGTEIFSPASVNRYLADGAPAEPKDYLLESPGNEIIYAALRKPAPDVLEAVSALLRGEAVFAGTDEGTPYTDFTDIDGICTLLLLYGYLKVRDPETAGTGRKRERLFGMHDSCLAVADMESMDALSRIMSGI